LSIYKKGYLSEEDFLQGGHYLQVKCVFPFNKARWIGLFLTHLVSTMTGYTGHKAYYVLQSAGLD